MSTLPPVLIQCPKRYPSLVEQMVCPSIKLARIHLIKDKDAIDHYLAMNIKGLSKQEAAAYRNSYKKNICIDMLRQGYHKSFSELFTLIQKWNALREAAGPGSAIWQQKSLEEQPDKLDQLHHFLTRAEAAQRAEYYEEVYNNQLKLAYCFNNTEDKWLRNYFYEQCLSTAQLIKIDGGKKEAEAHANMGLVNEEQGLFMKAAEHYETFHQLTLGRMWNDETGHTYNSLACEHLWRIYTLLADKMLENKEHQQAIKTLIKAFEMAKKGGDKKMEGEAAYCLGLAYHSAGEEQTAIITLNTYKEISTELCDIVGLGRAYQAIAKVLVSQVKVTEAIEYLEKFVTVAKSAQLSRSLVDACISLGDIYNERGNYYKACEYFNQAFEAANTLTDLPLVDETKVYYGIAKAHNMMVAVNSHTDAADHVNIEYLLAWKENRSDMCTDPFTVELAKDTSGVLETNELFLQTPVQEPL
ncbi:tetratricopeptide repeat protein 29 isoform X2 [Mauremys reevesii]|nr:tetratricopeptide repeat protein 29 isoform X2 [Mauremys reevesii]XP_039395137.1 tetratricopeptide repeat protein 29 isoform X2 [Mauremys reevesii]XP_039395138.1 tetratricopeptide repeat protein 29 isoform X2 [Mauremys reevesii]XP_039395139.1 tetratricopeptide repeat protein 29 isoform X2 [Mauremys reevesii]XP_039395141.1 tetratricopeptide repeat protein 29 isoform X2 [Mauremys reevesii]